MCGYSAESDRGDADHRKKVHRAIFHRYQYPVCCTDCHCRPAVLTNASSVLALGTSNRLARVVDRTRLVAAELGTLEPGGPDYQIWIAQLDPLHTRAQQLLLALRLFYADLGLFAASALVSVGGSIASYYGQKFVFQVAAGLAILTGTSAVVALCAGCVLMAHETRLAVQSISEEARMRARRHMMQRK